MATDPKKPPQQDQRYTDYFTNYGAFLASWLFYELVIEMLIKRELNLGVREASIVCCAIPFGVKYNILLALMARDPKNLDGLAAIKKVQKLAERNNIAHGFLRFVPGSTHDIVVINRDIKEGKYTVKPKALDTLVHMREFIIAFAALQEWAGINDQDLESYAAQLQADAKAPPNQDSGRPEDHANFQQPNPAQSPIPDQSGGE